MRLTVLPASFFLRKLVADKDIRKAPILAEDFVSWAASDEMSSTLCERLKPQIFES